MSNEDTKTKYFTQGRKRKKGLISASELKEIIMKKDEELDTEILEKVKLVLFDSRRWKIEGAGLDDLVVENEVEFVLLKKWREKREEKQQKEMEKYVKSLDKSMSKIKL